MNKKLKNVLLYFAVPVIAIVLLFKYHVLLGIAGIATYIVLIAFAARAVLFSLVGSFKYSRGNVEEALSLFDKAYKSGKAKPRTIISYAYLLLKSGNAGKSGEILDSLLNSKLESDEKMLAKSNLALVLWKRGELDHAVAMLEEVFQDFKTSTLYGSLGYLLILKGDLDRALQFNLEAYDYNSSNTVILDNLGQTYYLRGDYDKAEEIYEKLLQSNPTFPEAYYNYGLVLEKKGDKVNALEAMHKSLNYKLSFLSTVSAEEINTAIERLKPQVEGIADPKD